MSESKTGRNDPCRCGSGKKYKKCCLPKQEAEAAKARTAAREAAKAAPPPAEDDAQHEHGPGCRH